MLHSMQSDTAPPKKIASSITTTPTRNSKPNPRGYNMIFVSSIAFTLAYIFTAFAIIDAEGWAWKRL